MSQIAPPVIPAIAENAPYPAATPESFFEPQFDDGAWGTIPVPSNWQMHGYDLPRYIDVGYAFPKDDLPRVPGDDNPTGLYRHQFVLPDEFQFL